MEKLKKIADAKLNGIISFYKDETKDWWKLVDEDAIYKAIEESEFEKYVCLIAEDTYYSDACNAI